MLSHELVELITLVLAPNGTLVLQTNAEDVALEMNRTVYAVAGATLRVEAHREDPLTTRETAASNTIGHQQLRQVRWKDTGGESSIPPDFGEQWEPSEGWALRLPSGSAGCALRYQHSPDQGARRARSETEAAYEFERKPVFRLLFRKVSAPAQSQYP